MQEERKLKEARYFYQRMLESHPDPEPFIFNLSAFLSAARSVLQYMLDEVAPRREETKSCGCKVYRRADGEGKRWYEKQFSMCQTLTFFRKQRNFNIHTSPVQPNQSVAITISSPPLSASVGLLRIQEDQLCPDDLGSEQSPVPQPSAPPSTTMRYSFADWPGGGSNDVMDLCKLHLEELKAVLEDGIRRNFL